MDANRLTQKVQEALNAAQARAIRLSHQQVDVEHLLSALLEQERGLAPSILQKAGIDLGGVKRRTDQELEQLPKVSTPSGSPDQIYITGRLNRLLTQAEDEAKRLKDDYLSVEHLLLAVVEAVVRARSGLKDPNRPIGSFIFLGPTGVGKTELARALAEFKNTIVIMTSNIGSHRILEYRGAFKGEAYERMKQAVLEEMRRHFRPEFLNRVDEIIVFHALSEEHLKQIVEIQLGYLRKRLAERHIQIELTEAAREYLVRIGYDPTYGARPLKRAIQKEVETPLARLILKGEIRDVQTVIADYDPSRRELQFTRQEEAELAAG
jgi:ATP-dependent Clp protease ATP-binding subunit ClpA